MSVVTGNDIMKLIRAIKTDSKRGFYITQPVRNKRGKMTYKRKYLNKQEIAKIRNQMVAKVDRSKFRDINQVFIYGQTKKRTYKRKKKEEPEQIQQTDKSTGYRLPSLASQFYSQGNRAYVGRNIETSALQGIKDLEQLKSKDKEIERLRGIVNTRSLKEYDDRALKQQADKLIQKERELTFLKNQLVEFEDKMNKLIAQRIDPKVIEDMKNVRDKMLKEINDMRTQMVKDEKDFMEREKLVVERLQEREKEVSQLRENEVLLRRLKHLINIGSIRVSNGNPDATGNIQPIKADFVEGHYRTLTDIRPEPHRAGWHDLGGTIAFDRHRDVWEEVIKERQGHPRLIRYLQNYDDT